VGWSWWHKVLLKPKPSNFGGMGSWTRSLGNGVWDAMLFQPTQPTLANVFQLSKWIKMNMVEKHVVTLGFNKENVKNSPMPLIQQPKGQSNKAMPQKGKETK